MNGREVGDGEMVAALRHQLSAVFADAIGKLVLSLALDFERGVPAQGGGSIVELHSIRHDLYALRRVLTSTRDAIAALARSGGTTVSDATRVYLRDGQDHAAQLLDSVDACREHSVSLAELYDSRLNQRMNDIMKLLTLISTVFIPLSFITGVYGMNFETSASPWNMPELRWRYGYPFALGLMVCAALGLVWFFHRKGWLGTNGDDQPKTRGSSSGATRSS